MNRAVETMLKQYRLHAVGDYELALKEILQEIALLGLYRARFFEHAAYYGGSALRVLYDLNRFSRTWTSLCSSRTRRSSLIDTVALLNESCVVLDLSSPWSPA